MFCLHRNNEKNVNKLKQIGKNMKNGLPIYIFFNSQVWTENNCTNSLVKFKLWVSTYMVSR
jgi:hypothetical protein